MLASIVLIQSAVINQGGIMFIRRKYYRRKYRKNYLFGYLKIGFVFLLILTSISIAINSKDEEKSPLPEINEKKQEIRSISRNQAYTRGMDIINYVWEYNFHRNGSRNRADIEQPYYLKDTEITKTSGIPYCWGGYISLDISNQKDVKNFQEAVARGYTTGNVNSSGGYVDFTAGLDCSGFVSAVFNLPEKCSTQSLNQYFEEIQIDELMPMDIFNSEKNHTFIFIKETSDKKGIITMESTTNKYARTRDKTVINYRSWEEIDEGINGQPYVPMRYKGIIDDEVSDLKDANEYNNDKKYSINTEFKKLNKGVIDYADDVDFYKINISKKGTYNLNIINISDNYKVTILSSKDEVIKEISTRGNYPINIEKGIYYFKVESADLRFDVNNEYVISFN
jgi:hypothetical protein